MYTFIIVDGWAAIKIVSYMCCAVLERKNKRTNMRERERGGKNGVLRAVAAAAASAWLLRNLFVFLLFYFVFILQND